MVTAASSTESGHHVLVGGGQPEQPHPVVDGGDDQPAEEGVDHLAAPAEEAGAADDRRGHGVEHEGATVDVVRDRPEAGGVEDAGDARRQSGQRERPQAVPPEADPGPSRRLGVVPDGVEVPPEPGPAEEERPHGQHAEHDEDHVGDAPQGDEDPRGWCCRSARPRSPRSHDRHLQHTHGERRRHQAAVPAVSVPQQRDAPNAATATIITIQPAVVLMLPLARSRSTELVRRMVPPVPLAFTR